MNDTRQDNQIHCLEAEKEAMCYASHEKNPSTLCFFYLQLTDPLPSHKRSPQLICEPSDNRPTKNHNFLQDAQTFLIQT